MSVRPWAWRSAWHAAKPCSRLLLWLAAIVLWTTNGVVNPEARLWAVFMVVQSLPFAAAVYVSMVNALEQMRHARTVFEATPATPVTTAPALQPAQ